MFTFNDVTSPVSLSLLTVVASVIVISLTKYLWNALKTPGPWGVPILGYYPFLKENIGQQLHKLTKKYGEVYIVNIAGQDFLHLGSIKALKEAHVNKADDFPSRGNKFSGVQCAFGDGLAFLEGEPWRAQRKFFVQSMREIGMSPNRVELQVPITEAIQSTLETLQKSAGQEVNISTLMYIACSNAIRRLVLGDAVTEEMAAKLNDAYLKILGPLTPVNMSLIGNLGWFILSRKPGFTSMLAARDEMYDLLRQILEEHKSHIDENQEPRDFIDLYLRERRLREKKGDSQAKYFSDRSLISSLVQVYGDGSTSMGFSIASFLRWLSSRPNVQDAIYQEICSVVGTERLPTWDDKVNLPLTNSALKEMIRTAWVTLFFPDLECVRDTTVLGVHVPKGTITILNFEALFKDPDVYENPDTVDITRFLPGKNKVDPPVTFGIGRRACAGEALVMTEFFLFLTALVQNFVFKGGPEMSNDIFNFEEEIKLKAIPRPGGLYS